MEGSVTPVCGSVKLVIWTVTTSASVVLLSTVASMALGQIALPGDELSKARGGPICACAGVTATASNSVTTTTAQRFDGLKARSFRVCVCARQPFYT